MQKTDRWIGHVSLDRPHYRHIAERMLTPGVANIDGFNNLIPTSFTGVMDYFVNEACDVYALTANSALPLADAIRAYHQALGMPSPDFVAVYANSRNSRHLADTLEEVVDLESMRLEPELAGKRVAILDQFVGSGHTVMLATAIANAAGARSAVAALGPQWYDDANLSEISADTLTSIHADFLKRVGNAAARRQVRLTKNGFDS